MDKLDFKKSTKDLVQLAYDTDAILHEYLVSFLIGTLDASISKMEGSTLTPHMIESSKNLRKKFKDNISFIQTQRHSTLLTLIEIHQKFGPSDTLNSLHKIHND